MKRLSRRWLRMLALAALCSRADATAETPPASDSFVDSIGVNIHARHTFGPYNDWTRIEQTISDIGIRYVRDIPDRYDKLNELSAATGVKIDVIMQDGETTTNSIDMYLLPTVMNRTKQLTNIAVLEGPNERDNFADWQAPLMEWQTALYQAVKADPQLASYPMLAPSVGPQYPDVLPQMSNYIDAGNFHLYPQGTPSWTVDGRIFRADQWAQGRPIYISETGYNSALNLGGATYPENIAAKYLTQAFFEYFSRGIKQSYVYELAQELDDSNFNDVEAQIGMVRSDFTYKPVAYAVKNLISVLKDPGDSFAPSSVDYTVTGGDANLKHVLLQKRDGSLYLALWQDVPLFDEVTRAEIPITPQSIQVTFADAMTAGETYLPVGSMTPTGSLSGVYSQVNVNVPGELMLLKLFRQGSWTAPATGTWQTTSNWISGVPNAPNAIAYFGAASAAHAISTDGSQITAGRITFDEIGSYHITGNSPLTLQATGNSAAIEVRRGSHQIDLPLTVASNATLRVAVGSTLRLSGAVTINARVGASQTGGFVSSESALGIGDNASYVLASGSGSVLRANGLSISAVSGKLDLRDNKLISAMPAGTWNGSNYTGVAGLVKRARGSGAWNGSGITTTMADAAAGLTTLAVATAGDVGKTSFGGHSVSASDTLVMYTYNGDANLSGRVDADDYFAIDARYNHSGSEFGFARGDFNYDGMINGDDYMLIDYAYVAQTAAFPSATTAAIAVPEPASLAIVALGALLCAKRRRIA